MENIINKFCNGYLCIDYAYGCYSCRKFETYKQARNYYSESFYQDDKEYTQAFKIPSFLPKKIRYYLLKYNIMKSISSNPKYHKLIHFDDIDD